MPSPLTRRDFLQATVAAGASVSLRPFSIARRIRTPTMRLGFIGVGARGTGHLRGMLQRDDVAVSALCDVDIGNLNRGLRLVEEARGVQPPMDVYDAAAWSVLSPLSEQSVAQGGHPLSIPNFANGQWMTNDRIFFTNREY